MTYLGIKQAKELGQFLILPKALHVLLFIRELNYLRLPSSL